MSLEPNKCASCGVLVPASAEHACTIEDLKSRVKQLQDLSDSLLKYAVQEFAWTFTLADKVAVKVEFHGSQITAQHVKSFAAIFASVAENYAEKTDEK